MPLQTTVISPRFGTIVHGVDVRELDDVAFKEIDELLSDRLALAFPGQELSPTEQARFARRFGPIQDRPDVGADAAEDARRFMVIGNRPAEGQPGVVGDGDMSLHFDQSYTERPVGLGLLYALEVPSAGGQTRLVSTEAGYDDLDHSARSRLEHMRVENVWNYDPNDGPSHSAEIDLSGRPSASASFPSCVHPAVVRSSRTGRPSLFVNGLQSRRLLDEDGSHHPDLLAEVVTHVEQQRYEIDHQWSVGDLVVWDNIALLHGRLPFDPAEARVLRRVSVQSGAIS